MDDEREVFVKGLQRMMKIKKITQTELADKLGTTQTTISKYINGKSIPNSMVSRNISKILDCRLDDFFDYEKD